MRTRAGAMAAASPFASGLSTSPTPSTLLPALRPIWKDIKAHIPCEKNVTVQYISEVFSRANQLVSKAHNHDQLDKVDHERVVILGRDSVKISHTARQHY